jgi:4-aminobutyrate aminotransferase-like enzyme
VLAVIEDEGLMASAEVVGNLLMAGLRQCVSSPDPMDPTRSVGYKGKKL